MKNITIMAMILLAGAVKLLAVSNSGGVQADLTTGLVVAPTNFWATTATNDTAFSNAVNTVARPNGGPTNGLTLAQTIQVAADMMATNPVPVLSAVTASNMPNLTAGQNISITTTGTVTTISASLTLSSNLAGGFGYVFFTPLNYSTKAVQDALNTNGLVFFYSGDYYLTNLWMTNGSFISGYGATLHQTNRSRQFITATNFFCLGIEGATIAGDSTVTWGANPGGFLIPFSPVNQNPNPMITGYSNRDGLLINAGSPAVYRDLIIKGFEGVGLICCNPNNAYVPIEAVKFSSVTCVSNYIGIETAPDNTWLNFPDGLSGRNGSAEYMPLKGLSANLNTFGILAGAGNINITGDVFVYNWCGVFFNNAGNMGHGVLADCTINHSVWAIVANDLYLGELIQGNSIAGSGSFCMNNASSLEFKNNRISIGPNDSNLFIFMEDNS